jgi:tRNA_anti-like
MRPFMCKVISVICCVLWGGVVHGQGAPKAKEEPKPIEILAEDLAREHAADPEKTWDKYQGKRVQVTGTVHSVFDDILYLQTTVEFKGRGIRVSISYRKGTKPAVKAGEQVTFVGKYDRAGVFGPAVVDCDLLKAPEKK